MKDALKIALSTIAALVLFLGLVWLATGNIFFLYKFFAPKYEGVRRQVFEQTKSYNQGMIQELQNMQFAYLQADTNHQAALASIILHRAADYDMTILAQKNPDLYQFIEQLKQKNTTTP